MGYSTLNCVTFYLCLTLELSNIAQSVPLNVYPNANILFSAASFANIPFHMSHEKLTSPRKPFCPHAIKSWAWTACLNESIRLRGLVTCLADNIVEHGETRQLTLAVMIKFIPYAAGHSSTKLKPLLYWLFIYLIILVSQIKCTSSLHSRRPEKPPTSSHG